MLEKVVLVSLLTVIFSRILPAVQVSTVLIAVGAAVVIVATTVISEWLVRYGVRWQSAVLQFVVMGVVNALTLLASWLTTRLFGVGLVIDGFWSALAGALLISLVSTVLNGFLSRG